MLLCRKMLIQTLSGTCLNDFAHVVPARGHFCLVNYDVANKCLKLHPIKNGAFNSTKHDIGVAISFSCDSGYEIVGNVIINCIRDGQYSIWNGLPPKCYSKGIRKIKSYRELRE